MVVHVSRLYAHAVRRAIRSEKKSDVQIPPVYKQKVIFEHIKMDDRADGNERIEAAQRGSTSRATCTHAAIADTMRKQVLHNTNVHRL